MTPTKEITVEDLEKICRSADEVCYFCDAGEWLTIDGNFEHGKILAGLNAFVMAAYEDGRKCGIRQMDGAYARLGGSFGTGAEGGRMVEAEAEIRELRGEFAL